MLLYRQNCNGLDKWSRVDRKQKKYIMVVEGTACREKWVREIQAPYRELMAC